jgi:hypothetical protein
MAISVRARAVALALVFSTGAASGAERVRMPFDCAISEGRARLYPSEGDRSYAVVGAHERQVFSTCSPGDPNNCRNWLIHRFAFECDGQRVTWLEAAGSAARGANWDAWVEAGRFTMRMNRDWAVAPARRARHWGWRGRFAGRPGFGAEGRDDFDDRPGFGNQAYDEDHVVSLPPGFAPVMGIPLTFTGGTEPQVALGKEPGGRESGDWAPRTSDTYAPPLGSAGPESGAAAVEGWSATPATPDLPERAPPRRPAAATAAKSEPAKTQTAKAETPKPEADLAPLLGSAGSAAPTAAATSTSPAAPAAPVASAPAPAAAAPPQAAPGTVQEPKILNAPAAAGAATIAKTAGASADVPAAASTSGGERRTAAAGPAAAAGAATAPETAALPASQPMDSGALASGALATGIAASLLVVLSISAFALWRRVRTVSAIADARDISSITLDRAPKVTVPVRADRPAAAPVSGDRTVPPTLGAIEDYPVPTSYEQALSILGAAPDATPSALKKIVDGMRQSWHPDNASSEADRRLREKRLRQINVAWDLISKHGSGSQAA